MTRGGEEAKVVLNSNAVLVVHSITMQHSGMPVYWVTNVNWCHAVTMV